MEIFPQLRIGGKHFNVVQGTVSVDYDVLPTLSLDEIPVGVMVLYTGYPLEAVDTVGLCNLGGGKADVYVSCALGAFAEAPLSSHAYSKALDFLLQERAEKLGDVKPWGRFLHLSGEFAWFIVTVNSASTKEMFENAKATAEQILQPLWELEREVDARIHSL